MVLISCSWLSPWLVATAQMTHWSWVDHGLTIVCGPSAMVRWSRCLTTDDDPQCWQLTIQVHGDDWCGWMMLDNSSWFQIMVNNYGYGWFIVMFPMVARDITSTEHDMTHKQWLVAAANSALRPQPHQLNLQCHLRAEEKWRHQNDLMISNWINGLLANETQWLMLLAWSILTYINHPKESQRWICTKKNSFQPEMNPPLFGHLASTTVILGF